MAESLEGRRTSAWPAVSIDVTLITAIASVSKRPEAYAGAHSDSYGPKGEHRSSRWGLMAISDDNSCGRLSAYRLCIDGFRRPRLRSVPSSGFLVQPCPDDPPVACRSFAWKTAAMHDPGRQVMEPQHRPGYSPAFASWASSTSGPPWTMSPENRFPRAAFHTAVHPAG